MATGGEEPQNHSSYATVDIYASAAENIFLYSAPVSEDAVKVQGYEFNNGIDFHAMMDTFKSSGFQATNLYEAMEIIKQIVIIALLLFIQNNCFLILMYYDLDRNARKNAWL